jgi:diaminopimelate decarboxylase
MFNSQLIEKFRKYPTPFYYYDLDLLRENLKVLKRSSSYKIHYALKANADQRLLKVICEYGFGADCVSGNELKRALQIGFPKDEIVFAGVGKTDKEIILALENEIQCLNCESLQELEVVNNLSQKMGRVAPVSLRLNPGLDAKTHQYITTGLEENKFGISQLEFNALMNSLHRFKHLNMIGLHFHIGSQITDLNVFKNLCLKVNEIQKWLSQNSIRLAHLNLGGGLGVNYLHPDENLIPDYAGYFQVFQRYLKLLPWQTVHFELGRAVVAQCGALISRVLYTKKGINTQFAILDAGMTELIRPALYHGFHKIENLTGAKGTQKYDVVGPVCESSDFFGKGVVLPETQRGDLIAIRTVGAYGEVMASRYNLRDPAKVVYSDRV